MLQQIHVCLANTVDQLQHANVSCVTSAKDRICHPYINVLCVCRCACVCMCVCGVQGTVGACMQRVVSCVGWMIIWLVRLMLEFSLFGILSQLSRTSSSSKRRCESVMNLMY